MRMRSPQSLSMITSDRRCWEVQSEIVLNLSRIARMHRARAGGLGETIGSRARAICRKPPLGVGLG
jgi:hypothetical protein